MSRVLCAWEFGGDLGHVRRLVPIAAELRAMGHEVSFAFRDGSHLESARAQGFEAFAAPLLRSPAIPNPSPINFSDVLLNLGFDDLAGVAGALRAWRSLIGLLTPDVVVADYAPTALIAARAMSIPRVTVGSGFSQPRLVDPLPALRPWAHADRNVLRALDDRLLASVGAAMNGAARPAHARDLFEAGAHLLCTFPEIDPFGPREGGEYVGPQGDAVTGVDVRWSEARGARVFAYLKPRDPRFAAVLAGLAALDAEVIVAAPGLTPGEARAACTPGMQVLDSAVNVELVLPHASLCVSHGGPGLTARALAAGVPMALLPLQLEQFLVSSRVKEGGSAGVVSAEGHAPAFGPWFASLLTSPGLRQAAHRHAETHRGHSFRDATRRAAERIAAVAAG